jgi:hypothetical protein
MAESRSVKITNETYGELNALKVRLAVSRDNRIPTVSDMIAGMMTVSNAHYDELLAALTARENPE